MNGVVRAGTVLLLIAAITVTALAGWTYRRDRNRYQLQYTRMVKQRDIADSARLAISVLQDAELRIQDYVLTGETSYSEAYAKDVRDWQDESGTFELLARGDAAAPMIRDLATNGGRVVNELMQISSLYDTGSRDAAIDRIRKGSAIVYLEQARETVGEIVRLDGVGADENTQGVINDALRVQSRLVAATASLFLLSVAGIVFFLVQMRQARRAVALGSGERNSATVAR